MQNNSVDKSIFHFFGARIWMPMPLNQYEFPCGYVTGHICHRNLNWLLNLSLICKTLGWGRKWLIDFNAGNIDGSVFEEKLSFKILGVTFSSKLDWETYIISIIKTASKKIGVFSMNFNKVSFSKVAVYLYKSTIRPCME